MGEHSPHQDQAERPPTSESDLMPDPTENEAPDVVEAMADQVQGTDNAPAEHGGTSEQSSEAPSLINLDDVPEGPQRDYLLAREKEMQGAFTRRMQELAAQRGEIAPVLTLQQALQSDDPAVKDAAMAEFLSQHGYALDLGEAAPVDDPEATAPDPVDELRARLDARDAQEAADRAAAQESQALQVAVEHAADAISAYETAEGVKLTDANKDSVIRHVAALPRLENGLPDMESAIKLWEADRAEAVASYLASKGGEPAPDLTGSSGAPPVDLGTRAARIARANEIAERVGAQHA